MAIYSCKYGYHCLSILHYYNLPLQCKKYCKRLARHRLQMGLKISTLKPAMRLISTCMCNFMLAYLLLILSSIVLIHDSLENTTCLPELGQCLATVTAPYD